MTEPSDPSPLCPSPDITVIVPVLNEEATIEEVVERLLALPLSIQVIVVDDGSTDETPKILERFGDRIEVLRNEVKSGKGSAIRKALPEARGKVTIIQDADLEYAPEEIPILVGPILRGETNVTFGNRFSEGLPRGMALPNKVVNRLLAGTVRVLFRTKLSDEATCYKAVRTDLLRSFDLECRRFEFCPEVTAKALNRGERILEVPISYVPRTKEAGKKIRWTDAPDAFWTLFKHRFRRGR